MPTLLERIEADIVEARKGASDPDGAVRILRAADRDALVFLLSEARAPGKNKGNRDSTDEEVITVIRHIMSGLTQTIDLIKGTSRDSETGALAMDLDRLRKYLPAQLDADQVRAIVADLVTAHGKNQKSVGIIMGHFKKTYPGGQYDPKAVSAIALELISTED